MHRGFYVATVLAPLIIGFSCLMFGLFTDYWTKLDYTKIREIEHDHLGESATFVTNKVRFEFPKFSNLFDECNEYKLIEVLEPIRPSSTALLVDEASANKSDEYIFRPNEVGKVEKCLSRDECNEQNPNENGSCFCCKREDGEECCHPRSNLCNGVHNCGDKSDELDNCPLRKVFYSNSWYDNKHKCQRNQYNFVAFIKEALNFGNRFNNQTASGDLCLTRLIKSNNFTVRIFLLRLLTLIGFGACILFTILCFVTVLFVSCCRNLKTQSCASSEQVGNDFNYADSGDDEELSSSSSKLAGCCCQCNCLLCPFVFYSIFSVLAFIFHLAGLVVYIYSLCYVRNAYLIFDSGFQPARITKAYQYNPWLFGVQQIGISFYAVLVSFVFYLIVFISSTCISCRIQMSPAWHGRYTSSYEVLQMQDIVFNNKNLNKKLPVAATKSKSGKKKKEKTLEENLDEFSVNSGDMQGLTRPKTNITAIDNSYE